MQQNGATIQTGELTREEQRTGIAIYSDKELKHQLKDLQVLAETDQLAEAHANIDKVILQTVNELSMLVSCNKVISPT